jgi:ferredoxin--NADP+ reductase
VVLLGRRGPAQAAFTTPELRELGELTRADLIVDPSELELDPASAAWLGSDSADTVARRNVELLRHYSAREPRGQSRRVELRFKRSPAEIVTDASGRTRSIVVDRNQIVPDPSGRLMAVPTRERESIDCGLVLRAIGYRGRPLPGVPFDEVRGLIPNARGRVLDHTGAAIPGEYVVGWIKRGPVGVIGTNKKDATETVAAIMHDIDAGVVTAASPASDTRAVNRWLAERVPGLVDWEGWLRIDEHERRSGEPHGRPRAKLVQVTEMISVARRISAAGDAAVSAPLSGK